MQATIKGKTAGGIVKGAQIMQTRAGLWEIFVSHPHQCIATIGAREDGWGGTVSDVLVLTDITGLVARLEMSAKALAKMEALEARIESMYTIQA